jgi:hypothetical protein
VVGLRLSSKPGGGAKIRLKASGATVPIPDAFSDTRLFEQTPSVTVLLANTNGRCWTADYTETGTAENSRLRFRAGQR